MIPQSYFGEIILAGVGGLLVVIGLLMEHFGDRDWYEYKRLPETRSKSLQFIGVWFVIIGVGVEVVVACITAKSEWQNRPSNRPITSISAVATFRIKGDFSPPPLPYPDLGEMSGAGIMFLEGTNVSDKIPSIGLGADAPNISILNLIPNNVHPDTHDVVISFHDSGDVTYGHYFNKWMWQNKAGFFDRVKGFSISMKQIGSNVSVLTGNVVVIANDQKWEFPIPAQKQRLGMISCKMTKGPDGQVHAEVMPVDLMDITGRPLGHFDGK